MAAVKGRSVKIAGHHLFYFQFSQVLLYALLTLFVLFTALPLVYVAVTAFKPLDELFIFPPKFFTSHPVTDNFYSLLATLDNSSVPFSRYMFNSVLVSVCVVAGTVVISTMAAYGLVKHHPAGSDFIFAVILAGLMFSTHVTQIPNYMVVKGLGLLDSYWALILPKVGTAFNMFLMKQFMEQLPQEYIEAARIDGAGEIKVFTKIVIPFVKPAMATLVVFSFVSTWNDYFSPLIFTSSGAMKTLPLAIQSIAGGAGAASLATAGTMAAATFVTMIPTILIYTFMQSKVINTMSYSGIKG